MDYNDTGTALKDGCRKCWNAYDFMRKSVLPTKSVTARHIRTPDYRALSVGIQEACDHFIYVATMANGNTNNMDIPALMKYLHSDISKSQGDYIRSEIENLRTYKKMEAMNDSELILRALMVTGSELIYKSAVALIANRHNNMEKIENKRQTEIPYENRFDESIMEGVVDKTVIVIPENFDLRDFSLNSQYREYLSGVTTFLRNFGGICAKINVSPEKIVDEELGRMKKHAFMDPYFKNLEKKKPRGIFNLKEIFNI
jgi:hypothetical protein